MTEPSATPRRSNGHAKPMLPFDEAACSNWPGAPRAAAMLQVTIRRFNKIVSKGDLMPYHDKSGHRRFNPTDLDEYIAEMREVPPDDEYDEEDKVAAGLSLPAELLKAITEALKASNQQVLELHKIAVSSFKASNDAQAKTIEVLMARDDKHESQVLKLYEARETYFDAQMERELVRKQQDAASHRRQQMLDGTMNHLGVFAELAKKKWGIDPDSMRKLDAGMALMSALSPQQLEVAAGFGFFNEEQINHLETILGRKIERPQAAPMAAPPTEATSTNKESPGAAGSSPAASGSSSHAETSATERPPSPAADDLPIDSIGQTEGA